MQPGRQKTPCARTARQQGGKVAKEFEPIKRQSIELGDVLPGTTADFMNLGRVLKEQGLQPDVLAYGTLKAAAYTSVVLDTQQEFGGEFIVKLMEVRGVRDADLMRAADLVQRARFGFGIKPGDMPDTLKYDSATANIPGIKVMANMERLLAVQGMGAQVGLEGTSFGTHFNIFLQHMALAMARRGMKSEAQAILKDLSISFDFFDQADNFKGIEAMAKKLEKLEQFKKSKYGEEGAVLVSEQLFGAEAGRPAMVIAAKGMEGYRRNVQIMRRLADLQTRLTEKNATLRNAWEAVTGTFTNFAATVGSIFAPELRQTFRMINNWIGGPMTRWVQANKGMILLGVKIVGSFVTMKLALLGAAWGFSFFIGGTIRSLVTLWRLGRAGGAFIKLMQLGGLGKGAMLLRLFGLGAQRAVAIAGWLGRAWAFTSSGALRLAGMLGRLAVLGGQALLRLGTVMLTTPFGWFVLGAIAVAGIAYLIYRNWDRIAPMFGRAWARIKAGFTSVVNWFKSLSATFAQLGADLINGLIRGVAGKMQVAKNAIVGVGQSIKGWFANTLGIKSPSRIFMGFDLNIGEGAALGILRSVPGVQKAVGRLSALNMSDALAGGRAALSRTAGMGGDGYNIHFAPHITVQGGGNAGQAAQLTMAELERMLQRVLQEQQRRRLA